MAGVAIMATAIAGGQAEAQTRAYDLPAQAATDGIPAFAKQAGTQILASGDEVAGKRTNAVRGRYSVEDALKRLLQGTGLTASFNNQAGFITIRKTSAATVPSYQRASAATDPGQELANAPDIVVTGSRLAQANADTPAPVSVFDRERITQIGANGVADVLRNLPQETFATGESFSFAGSQAVQLRGLGLGTTLVLVNGRRTVTSALQGARSVFDLNMIPLPAVERVEVLSSASSAVYGSDAVGGVVNVILKSEIERPTVDLYYGLTPHGGNREKRASLSFGLNSSSVRSAFTFDYFDRDPLFGRDRSMVADADYTRFGSIDRRAQTANPGNVYSTTSANLRGLNSTFAAVPIGSTGVGLTPGSFAATAGKLNLDTLPRFSSIIPAARRISGMGTVEVDITDDVTGFGEFMYVDRKEVMTQPPASLANLVVPATNPFNPFGTPVRVNFLLSGLGAREQVSTSQFYRAVAGLKGKIGDWRWEVSGLLTGDSSLDRPVLALDQAKVTAALAARDPAQALNPFQDGPGGSPELLKSLYGAQIRNRFRSTSKQVGGHVSGPLFSLPAGRVELLVGGEIRNEAIVFNSNPTIHLDVDRKTWAGFTELRLPLVSKDMNIPLMRSLTLRAAGRYDHYNDFGGTANPELGLIWDVVSGLQLRASYGESFRAPSLFELYSPQVSTSQVAQIMDPRRNETYRIDVQMGGNTNLEPERARSYTLGAVIRPDFAPGLNVSIDYFNIRQNLRVQRFTTGVVVANEGLFPGRVIRLAPSAADTAAGLPGRVQSIDARSANFGGVATDGIDFNASYRIDTGFGLFVPTLSATYVASFKDSLVPGATVLDRAGRANLSGSIPEWRATGGLSWSLHGFRASVTGRYTSSYDDVNFLGVLTGRKVHSRMMTDAQISYRFGEGGGPSVLGGLTLRLGAVNLFNRRPPFSQVIDVNGLGYDPSQADLRQRFLYVALSKTF